LINVERRKAAADPQTEPDYLGCKSACWLPESTPTITIYYYSVRKLILIYRPAEGRRLSQPGWLVTYRDSLPARRRSPISVLTGSDVRNYVDRGQRVTNKPNGQSAMLCISAAYAVMWCMSVCPSVRLSVCPSVTFEYSVKQMYIQFFFHHRIATPFWSFRTKRYGNIPTKAPPLSRGVECSWGRQKSRFSMNIWLSDR